jgi:TatD DNase family protein
MTASKTRIDEARIGMRLVDSHCHLDDDAFEDDLPAVLERSRHAGVTRWINVGYSPDRWQSSISLAAVHPGLHYMLGVHPGHAYEWSDAVGEGLEATIARSHPVAVGEIGLDFYRGETNVDQQVAAFSTQLDIARRAGLPVAIHMRDAEPLMLQVLSEQESLPPILFHSFDGTSALTDWILEHDAWIGVGGLITRGKSHALQNQVKRIPLERIVLETDSPYLVPNGFKHRRNTPESIPHIVRFLSRLLDRTELEIAAITTHNAETLFDRLPAETPRG